MELSIFVAPGLGLLSFGSAFSSGGQVVQRGMWELDSPKLRRRQSPFLYPCLQDNKKTDEIL